MGRIALFSAIFLLIASPALAGQTGANFHVGMRIVSAQPAAAKAQAKSQAFIKRYTSGAAAVSVRRAGFGMLSSAQQVGAVYWFTASRSGVLYRIAVSVRDGTVVRIDPA